MQLVTSRKKNMKSVPSVSVYAHERVCAEGGEGKEGTFICSSDLIVRDKYGEAPPESSSSSSEEEDENAEELTSDVEKEFLRTLSLLKSKDPSIYNSKTEFYGRLAGSFLQHPV